MKALTVWETVNDGDLVRVSRGENTRVHRYVAGVKEDGINLGWYRKAGYRLEILERAPRYTDADLRNAHQEGAEQRMQAIIDALGYVANYALKKSKYRDGYVQAMLDIKDLTQENFDDLKMFAND